MAILAEADVGNKEALAFLCPDVSSTPEALCSYLVPSLSRTLRKRCTAPEGQGWEESTAGLPAGPVCLGLKGFLGTSVLKPEQIDSPGQTEKVGHTTQSFDLEKLVIELGIFPLERRYLEATYLLWSNF